MTSFGKKISCFYGAFTILTFYLLDVLCPIQENITVYKVSSKIIDLDFDRPKYNWINQVLGFSNCRIIQFCKSVCVLCSLSILLHIFCNRVVTN